MTPVGMMESGVLLKLRSGWSTGTREYIVGISILSECFVSKGCSKPGDVPQNADARRIFFRNAPFGDYGYF